MNCTLFAAAVLPSDSSLVLMDSAVKGTALLLLAVVAALAFRRDSAATRHLVWLLAMVAMLAVPALSLMLPEWRVLPRWMEVRLETAVADTSPPSMARPIDDPIRLPRDAEPVEIEGPSATAHRPAAELPSLPPASVAPEVTAEPCVSHWNWAVALPLAWATGFSSLILRLLAARWMLGNTERQAMVVRSSRQGARAGHDPIVTALEAVCGQLGIRRLPMLLIHSEKTVPAVWGIFRCRLLLPSAARHWGGEQLRSVLLHELAHIKRRDMLGQLLAQLACALHWFNPLAWFAAWRLGVERERACDDFVLTGGVRPSAYAEHLLDVATRLSPVGWTRTCSLVMARKPSLEGRLVAVLSEDRNRRRVSATLAAMALTITLGIAVPIAMLRAAEEKSGSDAKIATTDVKPKSGEKLEPGIEQQLLWGTPMNGLRVAMVIRPAPGEAKPGEFPDLYLAVQNVSNAPVRLNDKTPGAKPREVYEKHDGRILAGIVSKESTGTDVVLQPREVVFLLMFPSDAKRPVGRTTGSIMAEDLLQDKRMTMVAELRIEKAPAGAWTGAIRSGDTSGQAAASGPRPKSKEGQTLFKQWQANARIDGKIPGGLVGRLGKNVRGFISANKGDSENGRKLSEEFEKLLPRFDATRDWTPSDAIAIIDDVSAIHTSSLLSYRDSAEANAIRGGEPLPAELANAPWGKPSPDGLRVARLLEPRAKEYPLGTPLKSRILVYNAGKKTAIFIMPDYQDSWFAAHDANGAAINKSLMIAVTGIPQKRTYRLMPGMYCESPTSGVGVGANARERYWIDAKPGDIVRFTPTSVAVNCSPLLIGTGPDGRPRDFDPKDAADLLAQIIAERVGRELPLPTAAAEREQIIRRVTLDLFGQLPTPEEIAAFVGDKTPAAVANLEKRLAQRPDVAPFTGGLQPGDIEFRVLAPNPDAAKKPPAIAFTASQVLENLKKYDSIYESGLSLSGTMEELWEFNADTGALRREERRWKFTYDGDRWAWKRKVIHPEKQEYKLVGPKTIVRTEQWGYGGSDASGEYFQDTTYLVTPKNEVTEKGKAPLVMVYGPRDRQAAVGLHRYMWALGRMFSKELDKVTRVEKSKDGLLVVSARGRNPLYLSNGRWELDIEPEAAWMVRKARYYASGEPGQLYTEMTNSGTVWSGSYCIPKEATTNLFAFVSEKQARRLTFDPVVGKFDEKLYSDVQQAVAHNKEPNLKLDDERVSPPTFTEPNRPKPERTQR